MSAADIAVVAADVVAAAGLGWWFFGPKPTVAAAAVGGVQEVRVTVRGGYSPSRIQVRAGVPVRMTFSRQESGDCTSRVVFPDLGVSADLPAFAETTVTLPAVAAGEYGFACGMNMIHGVLTAAGGALAGADTTRPDALDAAAEQAADAVAAARVRDGSMQEASVVVDGGYHPARVLAAAGVPLRIVFDRREDAACSGRVVFPGTGVEASLAAHASTAVDLPPLSPGAHEFTCGMGMLHGTVEVTGTPAAGHHPRPGVVPALVVVPPVVVDGVVRPAPPDETELPGTGDGEAAERRAEIADLARRVTVGAVLTAPVLFGVMASDFFHPAWLPAILTNPWFALALITPVMLYTGRPIHRTGWLGLAHRSPDMNSLVTIGATAAFLYSLVVTIAPSLSPVKVRGVYYEEVGFILTLILLGRLLETRAKAGTGEAIRSLLGLRAKTARVIRAGAETELPISQVLP
jgi:P-type Cu+ transporter